MRRSWHSKLAYPPTLNRLQLRINWSPFPLFIALLWLAGVANSQQLNLTIPVTSPQIFYTPFVCNTTSVKNDPELCSGAWQLAADNATISAHGPALNSSSLIPQLFFQFRASDLFLTTQSSSNATVNITASSNGTAVSTMFDSSLRSATIVNLPDALSLLTITFVNSNAPTTFDLEAIIITTLQNGTITSILPTQTLPPSISLSFPTSTTISSTSSATTSTSTSPAAASSGSGNRRRIAEAVGLTVGISLGLTALISTIFYCWKRRWQREGSVSLGDTQSEWRNNARHG